ncbi:UNVERIFIED_CONTAM: hypothetical protein Sindi_1999100, partial [Sesamum indicum]
ARLTQRIRAAQARAAAESVAPPSATSTRPVAESSMAPKGSRPRSPFLIDVGSEDTGSRGLLRDVSHELLGSPNRSCTDESCPGGLVGQRRRRGKSPMRPNMRSRSQSLRVDPQSDSAAVQERRNMEMLNDVSNCWRKACEDLRTPNHLTAELTGEQLILDWKVSSSCTVLGSQSGQEIWELYNASCLPRNQATLLQTSFTRLEEHVAHWLIQAMESGKEIGFAAGHAAGKIAGAIEGRAEYLNSDDLCVRIREARIQGARDFIKAPAFETTLEIKATDYLMQEFDRCKAQVSTLNRFMPEFDATRLDPGLDGKMQPLPDEEAPPK